MHGIQIRSGHRLAHCDPLVVDVIQNTHIERTGDRPTTEQRRLEANPFFFAKRDDFHRKWKTLALTTPLRHATDRQLDAERAVVASAVAYRIEMRARHQQW